MMVGQAHHELRRILRAANWHRFWDRDVRFRNYTIHVPSFDRWLYVKLHRFGAMGKDDFAFFRHHIKPGMSVIDIGANLGLYSLVMADLVGDSGRVFAFEPAPSLYEAASKNIRQNGKERIIRLENLALGSRPSEAILYRTGFNSGDNRMVASPRHTEGVPIRIARLDDVLPDIKVDWIKMDVQGWEVEVLRGMQQTLRRNPSVRLYFEFWPAGLRHAGEDPRALTSMLRDAGLSIFHPVSQTALTEDEILRLATKHPTLNLMACQRLN